MKAKKKIFSVALAAALAATAVVSVSAAELSGTEDNPSDTGNTEVVAVIEGSGTGEVAYTITIPDKIDFGTLTQPETDADSYTTQTFAVTATKYNLTDSTKEVAVRVKDSTADIDSGDMSFYITNKTDSTKQLSYEVYNGEIGADGTEQMSGDSYNTNGYGFASFQSEGASVTGTIRLNQNQLYGVDLDEWAGEYSGYMTFYSTIQDATLSN